jgi:signal transduction histidine kinase
MRERVESLGGTFIIESEIGHGTVIIACLPRHVEGGIVQ